MTGDISTDHRGESEKRLETIVASSPILAPILERWSSVAPPDCWLSGGSIAQTVWNHASGLPPHYGLADVDLVYFDPSDLSEAGEARREKAVRDRFADLPVRIDVKNEARVHLWYEAKFGYAIAPYASARQAIATFPTTAAAIGVRPAPSGLSIVAPFGLSDLFALIVRPNKAQITRAIYEAKAERWRGLWPRLTIVPWSDD